MKNSRNIRAVDTHFHYLNRDWFHEKFWDIMVTQLSPHVRGRGVAMDEAEFRATILPQLYDPDGEAVLAKMDACGIDVSVIMHDDFGLALGETAVPLLDQNKAIAEFAARHPTRFVPCCAVDPRRTDAMDILERCIKDFGMKGVGECHPDAGWAPSGRAAYRMFERLQEWNVPVVTHAGLFFPPLHSRFDHPMLLDDVCADFPELTVVAAHSGRALWWKTTASLAAIHPNLYGELAGFQTMAFNKFPQFCEMLREYIDIAGSHKIVWATDDPMYDVVGMKAAKYLDLIRSLPKTAPDGIVFTEEEIERILGGNARRIFGLPQQAAVPAEETTSL